MDRQAEQVRLDRLVRRPCTFLTASTCPNPTTECLPRSANARTEFTSSLRSTYVGDDFPRYFLQASHKEMVQTVLEETFHFTTTHNTSRNWMAILPGQVGYIRLGAFHRVFAISIFHQLHCLVQIAGLLADMDPDSAPSTALPNWEDQNHSGHVQHCFNYIRQNILCGADETKEDGGWMCRDFKAFRTDGRERSCRDWSTVYKVVEERHEEWLRAAGKTDTMHSRACNTACPR